MDGWQVLLGAVTVIVGVMCFVLAFQASEINSLKKQRDQDVLELQRGYYEVRRAIGDVATEVGMVWVESGRSCYKKAQ
jgi:hypothetical protein